MTAWVIVPAKPPGVGKSRLAGVLNDEERQALVGWMLRRVVEVARGQDAEFRLLALGRDGLPDDVAIVAEAGGGLNAALQVGLAAALAAGIDRLVIVSGDVPLVTAADFLALLAHDPAVVRIAPDQAGTGTNALSLPLPAAAAFTFAYGAESLARHGDVARRLALRTDIVRSPTLALDIDTPDDLAHLRRTGVWPDRP